MFLTLFVAADLLNSDQTFQFQKVCMLNLLGLREGEGMTEALTSMGICNKETKIDDPCDWNGVRCTEDLITRIHWRNGFTVEFASIEWLPSAVMVFEIPNADVNSELDTRMLPENLTDCDMRNCGLHGAIELRTLPSEMRNLNLMSNRFSGTVTLANLPEHLRRVNLRLNPLKAVIVRNRDLPESLAFAKFYHHSKRVKIICLDDKKVDKRVYLPEYESLPSLSSGEWSCDSTSEAFSLSSSGSECIVD